MSKQPRNLTGKTAIVTGATGGVGKATARALVGEGIRIAIADLDQAKLDAVAAEIGGGTLAMALDVTDPSAYFEDIAEVERRLGPLDILVNVAGIMPVGPLENEHPRVNLHAVIQSTKEAVRRMKPRGSGHIVNFASGAGWLARGGGATYYASKFGVVGYSESASLELRGSGIDISVVAPAVIKTEMSIGLKEVKGVRAVALDELAAGIVEGLRHPKFAIFVPEAIGAMALLFSAIPYKVRHFLARTATTDKLLLDVDQGVRARYEAGLVAAAHTVKSRKPTDAEAAGGAPAPDTTRVSAADGREPAD